MTSKSIFNFKTFLLALYILVCGYYIYSILTTAQMMWDDYQFHFTIRPDNVGKFNHIGEKWQNFNDFLYSFIHHRDWMNGRIPDHIFLLIAYYGNMTACAILNAIAIFLTWILLVRSTSNKITVTNLSCGIIASLILLAAPDRALLWRAACVNYAWGCLLLLLLLAEIKKSKETYKPWLICLLSFLCGAWHEGLAAPLIASFIGYVTIQFFRKTDKELTKYILIIVSCFLGFLFILCAPAFRQGRVDLAATNVVNLSYWAGSVYRIIQYAAPAVAAYFFTVYLDRKNIWDNKLFYLATANIIPTMLIFARGGSWGGGSFFCSFCILLYSLDTLSPLCKNRGSSLWSFLSVTASIALLAYILSGVKEEKEYFNSIMSQQTNEPVRKCDYFKDSEIPWTLRAPFYRMEIPITTASIYYDKPEFKVVFNQKLKDDTVYSKFNQCDENETTWKVFPEYSVIRFAKGVSPLYEHSFKGSVDNMKKGNKTIHLHSSFASDWLARLLLNVSKKPYVTIYYSYHQGHYYAILPPSANEMDQITMKVNKDECPPEIITIQQKK